ncbi:probable proteinase [Oceanicaulis alexandrii HTCC2633]|uniref:S49 family peptidase n=1 Tax=Oceanicaulis sp. HTCC2633 TaxID=314254 RepID=UPI000066BC0A|nr:S49 family peptidase [Oceanicaulis sp. HTCC2633]EAP89048.1 probable proteinase [Oceanicaulis alexandrii HTCC2633] [Oceanicaulis sp. HTCC2633]
MSAKDTLKSAWDKTCQAVISLLGMDKPVVPVIRLEGVIMSGGRNANALNLQRVEKQIEKAFSMTDASAVALLINSPGGSPVQSRLIHERIRALANEKDKAVLAFCEDVAASGGYFLAVAADEIFVDPATIIGSIGVINAGFGFTEAMEKLGVERRVKTAGKSKLIADPFSPETDAQKERMERLLNTVHGQFIELVKSRRGEKLNPQEGEELFDGSVFTGTEALQNGIADEIGDLRSVVRARFGEDVRVKVFSPARQGPLSRLFGAALDGVELRAVWARFGL